MPGSVEKLAKKYRVSLKIAEKEWEDSKRIAEKQYGESFKSPKSDKNKNKNHKIYGTTMNIFKNKMKAHHGAKKNENRLHRFDNFLNETFDLYDEDLMYKERQDREYYDKLEQLQELFDNNHKNAPELDTNIPLYVEGWLKYKGESEEFAPKLTEWVIENYG